MSLDVYGRRNPFAVDPAVIAGMFHPVRCTRCHHVHDGGKVEVIARYADCSVWKCPGCGSSIDDRPIGWGGSAEQINRDGTVRR